MQSVSAFLSNQRRDGNGRRGVIALVAALLVFLVALALSSSPSYGATPKPPKKAAKKTKPKVKASVQRGQLNVLGTARGDRITLRLKRGDTSRLQVDVGGNGSAEFTFRRSRFNRIVVHAGNGADTMSVDETYGVFVNTEATTLSVTAEVTSSSAKARTPWRGSSSPEPARTSAMHGTATRSAPGSSGSTFDPEAARTRSSSTTSRAQGSAG